MVYLAFWNLSFFAKESHEERIDGRRLVRRSRENIELGGLPADPEALAPQELQIALHGLDALLSAPRGLCFVKPVP